MKKITIVSLAAVAVLLGIVYFGRKEAVKKDVVATPMTRKIRIGYNATNFNHSPAMIAFEKDIFRQNGLEVTPVLLKSGNEIQQALAANQIDLGITGSTNYFNPIAKGVPIKIIMPLVSLPSTIYVREGSGIKEIADLRGKRLGVNPSASSDMLLVLTVLKQYGIDKDDIKFVQVEKALKPIALVEKREIDASVLVESDKPQFEKAGAEELLGWKNSIYPKQAYTRNVAAVNTDFLRDNNEAVAAFVHSMIAAQKFIRDNNEEAATIAAAHMKKVANVEGMTPEKVQKAFGELQFMVWEDPASLQSIADTAFDLGELKTKLSTDQLMDLRFAPVLEQAQKDIYEKENN